MEQLLRLTPPMPAQRILPEDDSDDGDGHALAAGGAAVAAVGEEDFAAHADDNGAAALAEVAGAFEGLAEIRGALSRYRAVGLLYFYTLVRGDRLTKLHTRKAANECTALARGGWPKWWCDRYQFPLQKSFSFSRYGEESACALALEFCNRANVFTIFGLSLTTVSTTSLMNSIT